MKDSKSNSNSSFQPNTEIDDFSEFFNENIDPNISISSDQNISNNNNNIQNKQKQPDDFSDFFTENNLSSAMYDDITKQTQSPSKKSTGLFGELEKQYDANKPKNIMLNNYNYMGLLNEEKTNPKFLQAFEQVIATAASQGHIIQPASNEEIIAEDSNTSFQYLQQPAKYSLFRPKAGHIEGLIEHIESQHNAKCKAKNTVIFDPPFPEPEEFKINSDAERGTRVSLHIGWDVETNKHQKLYEEKYEIGEKQYLDIKGGVVGFHNAEAKRYVEYFHTRFQIKSFIEYNKEQNGHTYIRIMAPDPAEGFAHSIVENLLAQYLLTTIFENQKDLITFFDEFATDINYPIDTKILREFLYHENFDNFIAHNAKFDINRIIETRTKHKSKGFQFLFPECETHTLKLMYGKVTEHQDAISKRIFHLRQGNLDAGIRVKIGHNVKYNKTDGKPEIFFAPVQTDSQYSSYGIDTLTLAKASRVPPGKRGLKELSKETPFPALDDSEMALEDKQFTQSDFFLTEENKLSKASHYLYRDCLATVAVYGKLTDILALDDVEKATNIKLTHTHFKKFPYMNYIISTATEAKDFLRGAIVQETGLSIQEIEFNLKEQRKYFQNWITIKDTFYKADVPYTHEIPIFQAGKISTFIYGYVTAPDPSYLDYLLKLLDFRAQYPHMAWLGCAMKMIYLAGQNKLHLKKSTDVKELEKRFWYAVEWIIKDKQEKDIIPAKALIYLQGIASLQLKKYFMIRDNSINLQYPTKQPYKKPKHIRKCDKYVKGHKKLFISELAHAVIRYYELHEIDKKFSKWQKLTHEAKIKKLKSYIRFKEGEFLNFTADDVPDYGDELFTQISLLRETYKELAYKDPNNSVLYYLILEQKLKYLLTNLFGSTAEGISKPDFMGALLTPPVPTTITGLAKFCNNLSEIYLRKRKGIPLYTHTDSLGAFATQDTFDYVQNLFRWIPEKGKLSTFLEEEKKDNYQEIDFFLAIGKAKYAFHSAKTDKWTFTTSGSGVYGYTVNDSYEEMSKQLRLGKNIKEAIKEALPLFPNSYHIQFQKTFKEPQAAIKTLKRVTAGKSFTLDNKEWKVSKYPLEVLKYNDKVNIYCFKETYLSTSTRKNKKGKKITTTKKIARKIFSTTNDIYYNNFGDYRNFHILKIDKAKIKERKRLIAQIKEQAKLNPQKWRGWSKLKKIKDLRQALLTNELPEWAIPVYKSRKSVALTKLAEDTALKFKNITARQMQILMDLVEEYTNDVRNFDFESMDNTLEFDEIKTLIHEKWKKADSINSDAELFKRSKQEIEYDYELGLINEKNYNELIERLHVDFSKPLPSERKYDSRFPKGVNYIILYCASALDFEKYFKFILTNSVRLTDWEKQSIIKSWNEKPNRKAHLNRRYSYNPNFYLADLTPKYQTLVDNELKKRYPTKTKREQMRNKIVSELIFTEKRLKFMELEPRKETFGEKGIDSKSLPKDNDADYGSDMFILNGHYFVPDLMISEYQAGNKNRHYSQALENTARTMSCEHARTHIKDKDKLEATIKDYLFKKKVTNLPCPKGRKITSDSKKGFTTRMRFKAVPIFEVDENDTVDSVFFKITFNEYIENFLSSGIIEEITPKLYLIKDPTPINTIMNEIREFEWMTFDFYGKTWTYEIKKYTDHDVNGMFYVGGVVGKNLCINYSMRFNPTSNKMLNYQLFESNPAKLEKESNLVKIIYNKIIKTNTITAFTRNASFTTTDYGVKENPTDLLDKVYQVYAQIIIEEKAKHAITQLTQYDIAEDFAVKTPEIGKWTIRFLSMAMQDAYQEITSNINTVKQEIAFNRRINIGSSRKGYATDIQNPSRRRSHVTYQKNRTQIINKSKSIFAEYETPEAVFEHLEKNINLVHEVIRVETHLSSREAIRDPKSYERHKKWKELLELVIALVTRILKDSDNIINTLNSVIAEIKPKAKEFIYENALDVYEDPPIPSPVIHG